VLSGAVSPGAAGSGHKGTMLDSQRMSNASEAKGHIIVGEGVSAVGTFSVPGRASVHGSLQGELDADEVVVGPGGKVVGALRARHVELFGEARDTVVVSERLVIRSTGRADGQITYGEIEVERGAQLKGSLTCTRHGGADSAAPKPGSAKSGSGAGAPPKG